MLAFLERYFEFNLLGTNWRTEILAGITTFLTMAYIVLVNPAILAAAGVPLAAVMFVAETTGRPSFIVPGLLAAVAAELMMGASSITKLQQSAERHREGASPELRLVQQHSDGSESPLL